MESALTTLLTVAADRDHAVVGNVFLRILGCESGIEGRIDLLYP